MDLNLFAARRARFLDVMQDGIAIFKAAPEFPRNGDVAHPYRQDSNFHFLTGWDEADAYAVLEKDGEKRRFVLFVRPSDPVQEVWTGRRAGVAGATAVFGADEAFPQSEFSGRLPDLLNNRRRLYMEFGREPAFEGSVTAAIEALKAEARKNRCGPWEVIDPRTILWEMRLVKSAEDIAAIEKACQVTAAGVIAAMRAVRPGMTEAELQAVIEFEFRRRGASRVGFETICASGAHATTLHYISNDGVIGPRDMVLVDAGCEVEFSTGDVTRTFPASGRFTRAGRTVYQWVLAAQKAAIAAVRPGATYADVHLAALRVIVKGLVAMGMLKGRVKYLIDKEKYTPFFMHRIGHWLGTDVHDVGPYFTEGKSFVLRPGIVMTIEPGIYLPLIASVPKQLQGIGVRIEDDVLITGDGCRVLTSSVPKEPDEIEKLMRPRGSWWRQVRPASV